MFETVSDSELLTFMGEETREESAAMGRRLASVGELFERRNPGFELADLCAVDSMTAVAAEISAVQNISHARAVGQVGVAVTLRKRLPQILRRFCRGVIDYRLVATVVARTENVEDDIIAGLDEALAGRVEKWMKLSKNKLRDRIDSFVAEYDPAAVRVPPEVDEHRYVEITPTDTAGVAAVTGSLHAEVGAALDQRLDALAATVCDKDPRTKEQRRADACGPLSRLESRLACECGLDDCPAAEQHAAATAAVVHLLAEHGTLDGTSDKPGYLPGFGVLPAESVRGIAKNAQLKPVVLPRADAVADNGYRPSAGLTDFLRWRDLTCRWPGCDKPVQRCDVDHTVPWPYGPTHPSNTKHYCRTHHLVKTFLCGTGGWSDRQLPDGSIELIAPTGHLWRTEPHGAAMFPALGQSTGQLEIPPRSEPDDGADRLAMMPRRRQTREQDRRDRIDAERRQRSELIAEEQRQQQLLAEALARDCEPPPF
ncbi:MULTISPECIES: HNH endonuclease signature motif containing protein [unclassified Mycobacterium]|uniref:HNH endonuclease signature motif containing protein n=1 Tax=unclassified Mycobacterium TaxID=2642494 RepID=UPI00073FF7DD|nr:MULTISPECIES: HNH endonuclease signature motif containing protein [unclassified Mycobacterium]KUH87614.1 hypothetical protein AU186_03260 [Mycobacterium sp. GA-1999]KUH90208.1 hypothetical protein AU187_21935 [Mycobacterium sp. IS-1556]KUH90891.1 hypothetical protein AU185_04170 [Mycobacterium sp. GA-0227b]